MDPEIVNQQDELRETRDKASFDLGYERIPADFYPTPKSLREALLDNYTIPDGTVWEPCVGTGHLARAIEWRGHKVRGSDIRSESEGIYGQGGVDFLGQAWIPPDYTSIVTNPPFGMITDFIKHGLKLLNNDDNNLTNMVALCRQDHHFAATRTDLFGNAKYAIHCPWRPLWIEKAPGAVHGNPRWSFVWWVWEKHYTGMPQMCWVKRTVPPQQEFTE